MYQKFFSEPDILITILSLEVIRLFQCSRILTWTPYVRGSHVPIIWQGLVTTHYSLASSIT